MRNWKAIIFDMDGTLFDTETISMKAWKGWEKPFSFLQAMNLFYL